MTDRKMSLPLFIKPDRAVSDTREIRAAVSRLDAPLFAAWENDTLFISHEAGSEDSGLPVCATAPALCPENLGDSGFKADYGLSCALYGGAMANGISSVDMVVSLGKNGFMGSFGAGGLMLTRVEDAIHGIRAGLGNGPFAMNLIHSPYEPELERAVVDLYLKKGVKNVEAAAFLALTENVVRYRAAGLTALPDGRISIQNRVIAKVSRREVAEKFLAPAPEKLLTALREAGHLSEAQCRMAAQVPMADDITAEADSGGHTDNRPLVSLIPSMISLRDEVCSRFGYQTPVRVGAAGGIATPQAALAAFAMGAAFVTTGSVNQACVESGACGHVKTLLCGLDMADVAMAPAADMFEMGVKVQVARRGTLFPMRAQKLFDCYQRYASLDEIPGPERQKLESMIFHQSLDAVWEETRRFFEKRDPAQLAKAAQNPKRKMALVFKWYLGLSSRWPLSGEPGREMDYQIWCGPAMGAFNAWAAGTYLEKAEDRHVADVARQILRGACHLYRARHLALMGAPLPSELHSYRPEAPAEF
ncbi:MAG: PfaD family polyunsaturated fatty acid/polyketide biosynthesis protein [Thermodesulfobacteriota bacterium]